MRDRRECTDEWEDTTSNPAKTAVLRISTSDSLTLTVFGVRLHEWRRSPAPLVGGIVADAQTIIPPQARSEMSEETGADTGRSELTPLIGLFQLSMFGVGMPSAPASSSCSRWPSPSPGPR